IPRLAGEIFLRTNLKLVPVVRSRVRPQGATTVTVGIDLGACEIELLLSGTSRDRIREKIANTGLSEEDFETAAKDRLQQFFRSQGSVAVGSSFSFRLDPSRDGDILERPIRLTTITEIRCIDRGTIALFGTMFTANLGRGNAADKTRALLLPGQEVQV